MKKRIFKFLLPFLGLTTVAATTAPIIVSCSSDPTPQKPWPTTPEDIINGSKPAPGIDQNVFDTILKHTFGEKLPPDGDGFQPYENLISKQFQEQALNAQIAKTRDEVLQIAQDNLNKITDAELQEALNLNLAKGLAYGEISPINPNSIPEYPGYIFGYSSQTSLSNLKFDRMSYEISFDVNMYLNNHIKTNFITVGFYPQWQYRFSNIKIEPSVVEVNDNFIPSIGFDENQPNASLRLVKVDYIASSPEEWSEIWDKNIIPQDIKDILKTKENFIKLIQLYTYMTDKKLKQCLEKQLGVVDNKFTIRNITHYDQYQYIFDNGFISPLYFYQGWDPEQQIPKPLEAVEIAFSSMNPKTNQSQWQVFKKTI